MKKLFILLGLVLISFTVSSQSYLKYETSSDTTYIKKNGKKFFEIQEITTTDGKLITIKTEIKNKDKIIKELQTKVKMLKNDIKSIEEQISVATIDFEYQKKRKKRVKRKIKFIQKRIKNLEER